MAYKFVGAGLSTSEKRQYKKRFEEYIEIYPHLQKLSDLQLLEELVFLEALCIRIKEKISKLAKKKKVDEAEIVPAHMQKALKDNLEQQLLLKEKLGLFEDKQKLDAYQFIIQLFKKFAFWRGKNLGIRKVTCPWCSEIFFLMIRTDKYKAIKGTWFKDKVLCNPELWRCYKENKLTKEDLALIFGTSKDYIDWLEEKIYIKKSK